MSAAANSIVMICLGHRRLSFNLIDPEGLLPTANMESENDLSSEI